MQSHTRHHTGYYLSLVCMLLLGSYIISLVGADAQAQMLGVTFVTFLYVMWGIFHHYIHHDITRKVVLEYVIIGAFIETVAFFVLH